MFFEIRKKICANQRASFELKLSKTVLFYLDKFSFAAGCHVSQIQERKEKLLGYDSFAYFKIEHNYNIYQRKLQAILYFAKKYSHILNSQKTSTILSYHKPLITFLDSNYYENSFVRFVENLCLLNVCIVYNKKKHNKFADRLLGVLFYLHNCSLDF